MSKKLENRYQKANRILVEIVEQTLADSYLFTSEDVWSILLKKGQVEVNGEIKNDAGEFATRATTAGIEAVKAISVKKEIGDTEKSVKPIKESKRMFGIDKIAVEKPARSRTGNKTIYPFDDLEVGTSFFVPATKERPEPWMKMASTVSTAERRFAEPVLDEAGEPVMRQIKKGPKKGELTPQTKKTREFAIVKAEVEVDGVIVEGARIGRVS